jgi:hypothetical protein
MNMKRRLIKYLGDPLSVEEYSITGFGAEGNDFMLHLGPDDFSYPDLPIYDLTVTCTVSEDIKIHKGRGTNLVSAVAMYVTNVWDKTLLINSIKLRSSRRLTANTSEFRGLFTITKQAVHIILSTDDESLNTTLAFSNYEKAKSHVDFCNCGDRTYVTRLPIV